VNGNEFVSAATRFLLPLLAPMGFSMATTVSGRLYSAEFISPTHVVSISFEPGDDYWLVLIFTVKNGVRSDIDDRIATPRLADLNAKFLARDDGAALEMIRQRDPAIDPAERKIQRISAELALVLPRYLATN
jgi:hypothetical protein